jgi:uncharacterized protein (TIGR00369 family)
MHHHPLNTPIGRFRVETLEEGAAGCVATMPVHDLVNPVTGALSLGPLAVLLDHVGGLVNHHRRDDHEWTVSSELSLDLTPDATAVVAAGGGLPVRAASRPLGAKGNTAVGECHFRLGDTVIGSGTVRSFYIDTPGEFAESPERAGDMEAKSGLAAMMALGAPHADGESIVLPQLVDRVLNNSIDVVHGGIASTGLEVVASAAVNAGRADDPLTTATLRVNFLRQFFASDQSRYVGTTLRVGRRTGVAESKAIGVDGKVAIIARMTAYRC